MPNTSARKAPATAARELKVYVGTLPPRSPLISKKEKEQPVSTEETLCHADETMYPPRVEADQLLEQQVIDA